MELKYLKQIDVKSCSLKQLLHKKFQIWICIHAIYDFLKFSYIKCDLILKTGMLFSHSVQVRQKMPRLKTEKHPRLWVESARVACQYISIWTLLLFIVFGNFQRKKITRLLLWKCTGTHPGPGWLGQASSWKNLPSSHDQKNIWRGLGGCN